MWVQEYFCTKKYRFRGSNLLYNKFPLQLESSIHLSYHDQKRHLHRVEKQIGNDHLLIQKQR